MHEDFKTLWQEYYPKLMIFVRSFFQDQNDREDAIQEIFSRIFRAMDRYNPQFSRSTWIYRIARNYCIDCFRRKNRLEKFMQDCSSHYAAQDRVFNPEDMFFDVREKEKIREHILKLGETDQQLCYLYYYEELGYRDISWILKIPAGTLKDRMHRIRGKIKKGMEK